MKPNSSIKGSLGKFLQYEKKNFDDTITNSLRNLPEDAWTRSNHYPDYSLITFSTRCECVRISHILPAVEILLELHPLKEKTSYIVYETNQITTCRENYNKPAALEGQPNKIRRLEREREREREIRVIDKENPSN